MYLISNAGVYDFNVCAISKYVAIHKLYNEKML